MKKIVILLFSGLLGSGCILMDHEHPGCVGAYCGEQPGDVRFYWAFEQASGAATDSCYVAEMARMDIVIYDAWGDLEFEAPDRPCEDTGAIIDNFWPGAYELQLVGICPTGLVTHEGWWEFDVYTGVNDYGTLVLDYLGPCH